MKKLVVLLAVLLSLLLAQAGQAADLSSDWYVNLWEPNIYVYNQYGQPSLLGGGYFYDTPSGDYGPFRITDPYGSRLELRISIPHTVSGITPQQSLVIPFSTGLVSGAQIAYLGLAGVTDYDPAQMYLGLYRTRVDGSTETLWEQKQNGVVGMPGHIAYDTTVEGPFYFKLNVVPEPSTALCLLLGCASMARLIKKRRA